MTEPAAAVAPNRGVAMTAPAVAVAPNCGVAMIEAIAVIARPQAVAIHGSWQVIHLDAVLPTPWRNGGGVTRELACWPDSRDWVWRMSVAEVAASGPFSRFEGVQRWFAVLGGAGVRLRIGAQTHQLTGSSAPLCFDGASPVDCELLDGATQDFNLMQRGPRAGAAMRRIYGSHRFVLDAPKWVALYAIDSACQIVHEGAVMELPARTLAWQALPQGAMLQVSGGAALWLEVVA